MVSSLLSVVLKMMMNNLSTRLHWLVLLLLLPLWAWAADISVSVDRNPVNMDESFQIIFSASETPDGEPDFSPLNKAFQLGPINQSHNTSWINGKTSQTSKWIVSVMAKQSGQLQIPPIKFGQDSSQPLTIEVKPAGTNQPPVAKGSDLFLEVSASPEDPYLQAQVIYTLKLFTRVNIAQARLTEPELQDAVIEKLGDDSSYTTQLDGVDYSVTERSYAIFPQKSGRMTIKPLELTADVVTGGRSTFNSFFGSPFTRSKRLESKPITLNVRPQPASFDGIHWLPAEQLELKQEWSGDTRQMKVGEPLTRTLKLTARGASVGQLPELNASSDNEGLKVYPDQPLLNEQKVAGGVIAQRQEKLAFMPNKPGTYSLPEVSIAWFNTLTEKMEWAKLPEMTITVVGEPTPNHTATPLTGTQPEAKQPETPEIKLTGQPAQTYFWQALSAFLASGWLLTGLFFWPQAKRKHQADTALKLPDGHQQTRVADLRQACQTNDPIAAKNALLAWGKQFGETSLGAIAGHCEARLRDEILLLNHVLYGKGAAQDWQGKNLFQAFSENKARKKLLEKAEPALKPLYPT